MDTVFNQPNRWCVSTGRLNRLESQLVSFLEGESGPTPTYRKEPPTLIIPLNNVSEGERTRMSRPNRGRSL